MISLVNWVVSIYHQGLKHTDEYLHTLSISIQNDVNVFNQLYQHMELILLFYFILVLCTIRMLASPREATNHVKEIVLRTINNELYFQYESKIRYL